MTRQFRQDKSFVPRRIGILSLTCVTIATFTLVANNAPARWLPWAEVGFSALAIWMILGGTRMFPSMSDGARKVVPLGTFLLPMLFHVLVRQQSACGLSLEVQVIAGLRNLSASLLFLPQAKSSYGLAMGASVLAVVAVYLQHFTAFTSMVVVCFLVSGLWWLMVRNWSHLPTTAAHGAVRRIPGKAQLSVLSLMIFVGGIAILSVRSSNTTMALAGFMPSSGGQSWSSPFATSGVGDGEQMVSGTDDAKSFGPIDSGIFLESEQPSIYDIFNDMYSEPTTRKRKVSRSIPLAPQDTKMNHQHLPRTEQATREFTAVRRPYA